MVQIFVEPSYFSSVWCTKLLAGLTAELKLKHIDYTFLDSVDALSCECRYIYIIGTEPQWVRSVIIKCKAAKVYPIWLTNQGFKRIPKGYSTVSVDDPIVHAVKLLQYAKHTKIAFYGVNPNSVPDKSKMDSFREAMGYVGEENIYCNYGSFARCFHDFFYSGVEYDAVICANDFAAISLIRNLYEKAPEYLKKISIIGGAETCLTDFFSGLFTSVKIDFQEYGRAAVALLETLRMNSYIADIAVTIRWNFNSLDETSLSFADGIFDGEQLVIESKDSFYLDTEVQEMLQLERLLCQCDKTDITIIHLLLRDCSYETIARECYVSVGTIKYRLRKMIERSGSTKRCELIDKFKKYIPPQLR